MYDALGSIPMPPKNSMEQDQCSHPQDLVPSLCKQSNTLSVAKVQMVPDSSIKQATLVLKGSGTVSSSNGRVTLNSGVLTTVEKVI